MKIGWEYLFGMANGLLLAGVVAVLASRCM